MLTTLRVLAIAARFLLAGAMVALLKRGGVDLPLHAQRSWIALTVLFVVVTLDSSLIEAMIFVRGLADPVEALDRIFYSTYHFVYLFNALIAALIPVVVALTHLAGERLRWLPLGAGGVLLLLAIGGAALGALESWDRLLETTRAIAFLAVLVHLLFWTGLLLGHLPRVDVYLAGFVAVQTLWSLLLPVNEVFFQLVGRQQAREVWHILQLMQVLTPLAHAAIVLALMNALGAGRGLPRVPVPFPRAGSR